MDHFPNKESDVIVLKFYGMVYDSKSIEESQSELWTSVEQNCNLWSAVYAITAHSISAVSP